jgi:hypothetical protein
MGHNTLISIFAAFLILCVPVSALSDSADQLKKTTSDLVSATNKYKASVEALIPFYERALKSANETVEKRKELYASGIISKRDLEAGQQAVKAAQTQLEQARNQITESDQLIVEAKAEAELAARKPSLPSRGTYTATSAILRNSGSAGWTIANASNVQSFFASTFGRQLPVSAYGQSATHNRMGFDHRNSVDVALHPDSAEGKALIAYLRNNSIPFLAFRSAVAGAATGAHIHIGYPSHRI